MLGYEVVAVAKFVPKTVLTASCDVIASLATRWYDKSLVTSIIDILGTFTADSANYIVPIQVLYVEW